MGLHIVILRISQPIVIKRDYFEIEFIDLFKLASL